MRAARPDRGRGHVRWRFPLRDHPRCAICPRSAGGELPDHESHLANRRAAASRNQELLGAGDRVRVRVTLMARIRTFIAVELAPGIKERMTRLQESLGQSAEVKWVS